MMASRSCNTSRAGSQPAAHLPARAPTAAAAGAQAALPGSAMRPAGKPQRSVAAAAASAEPRTQAATPEQGLVRAVARSALGRYPAFATFLSFLPHCHMFPSRAAAGHHRHRPQPGCPRGAPAVPLEPVHLHPGFHRAERGQPGQLCKGLRPLRHCAREGGAGAGWGAAAAGTGRRRQQAGSPESIPPRAGQQAPRLGWGRGLALAGPAHIQLARLHPPSSPPTSFMLVPMPTCTTGQVGVPRVGSRRRRGADHRRLQRLAAHPHGARRFRHLERQAG